MKIRSASAMTSRGIPHRLSKTDGRRYIGAFSSSSRPPGADRATCRLVRQVFTSLSSVAACQGERMPFLASEIRSRTPRMRVPVVVDTLADRRPSFCAVVPHERHRYGLRWEGAPDILHSLSACASSTRVWTLCSASSRSASSFCCLASSRSARGTDPEGFARQDSQNADALRSRVR